ncbi:Outer membrane protein B [Rickettsia akari str. Hartford]|uniref:Outer membrane protein B n=3 Tax=Rickettsia TaxID=780 RepID=A8GPL7_RICAH|nr:outer membrane protein OmpB [Rickettsia akari]ABV75342.1 Outer membrane protein B [Rickettsia akari str. Hartford]
MAQKPNFLKKLISAGLVTASTATIVAGFAGSAMCAATQQNRTTVGAATTLDGVGFDQDAANANLAVVPNAVITANVNHGIDFNAPAGSLNGLLLNTANDLAVTVSENTTLGFVTNAANQANFFNLTLAAGKTLAITGQGITAAQAGATKNAQNVVAQVNGGNAVANNDLSGLGTIDFGGVPSALVFNLVNPTTQNAPLILGGNAKIANGANGTLDVTKGFIQVSDKSFATVKTINIGDGQGFIFNTDATNGNALNLQQVAGSTINFNGTDGTGRLVLLSKNGTTDFNVMTGSLGGNLKGIIEFNTTAVAGQLIANAGPANAVIGTNNGAGRAAGFVVSVDNGNAATVAGQVYAKDIVIQSANAGGQVNFNHIVDVGIDGTTTFKTADSKVIIAENSNLGATDFCNLGVQITVPDTKTLTGNFTGDASNKGNTAGVITFAANGTLASGNSDANVAVTNNIKAIEVAGAGVVQLSGTHTAELSLGNAGSVFKLADDTVINGKVNENALIGGAVAGGTIQLDGSATITGDIGNGAGNAALHGITLADDASKTLTLGGAKIIGVNAGGTINFQANGGTIKLTSTQNDILVNFNLAIAADKTGVVDASGLTNTQTLTIAGSIGTIAANNKTLDQLKIGSSATTLNIGDVAINELVIGNNGSVNLGHVNYLIAKTTNASGQGKIIANSTIVGNIGGNNCNVTRLMAGTNLGSAEAPLSEFNFAAPTGGAIGTVLEVLGGASIHANNITTIAPNNGFFRFVGGGTSIISGTVGTPANKIGGVYLDGNSTVQFAGNSVFDGHTFISGNSTLQIGGDYTADFIASDDNTGIVEFVNTSPIAVTLNKQAGLVDDLKQITVSGRGNVVINEIGNAGNNHAIKTNTISFENASLGAGLFLPSDTPLDGLTIKSTVGNGTPGNLNAPIVVVSGIDSVIADGQAIGDQNNIVGLCLGSDNGVTVDATTLYAGIGTTKNNQGTVTLNGGIPNTPGTIYGLGVGSDSPKLKQVTFATDYNNLGSIVATNVTINDGVTVTTGGVVGTDFDGTITLGSVNGNANVRFVDSTFSSPASMIVTTEANNGTVTYLGDAYVGNIGASDANIASVKFTGNHNGAGLQGNIYSQVTDFGTYTLTVLNSNVILGGGTTAINGAIDLLTNTLTFASGTSTWGSNTSIETTLTVANGNMGHIVIAENAQVNATDTGATTINVQDNANANFSGTKTYILIQGGARFNGTLGGPNFAVTGSNRFVNYALIRDANQDYVITRTNNAANVVTNDIANSPFASASGVGQNVTTFVNATNTAAYNNLLLAKNSADSADFVGAITTDTSAAVTNAQLDVAKDIQAQLGNRLGTLRYLGTHETAEMAGPEAGAIPAAVAAGDEAVDNVAYGVWAKPFYTDAHQSKKGGLAGYKAKTTGVVIGLDTLAHDNLMIGAAIGITKTDIKHQDYKKGDKTDINGFSFSLYGAQQLVKNFFAQGSAIFSLNHVKNKSQRYFFDANGKMNKQVAAGNYGNITFGGNLMVGYDYNALQGVLVTPMAGLSYLKSSDENYKESGTTVANKQVNSKFSDRTDLIVGAKVAGGTMNITDLAVYPEAHVFVVHKVNGRLSKTQSQLDGQVTPFISQPDRTAKTSYNLGLSASIRPDAKMEYGVGYDAQIASKYVAHQGTLKVRVNF